MNPVRKQHNISTKKIVNDKSKTKSLSNGMKIPVYNLKAEKTGTFELPKAFLDLKWNPDLVHQVIESMRANRRRGTAHAKDRSEVSGGGRKPWRQKGTGRARHGSIRSPIWVGGGVTHGPTSDKKYSKKINKKMKKKAMLTSLAKKIIDKEVIIIDSFGLGKPKTKEAAEALRNLSQIDGFSNLAKKGAKIIATPSNKESARALRNIHGIKVMEARNLSALDLLGARYLILGQKDILTLMKL